MKKGLYLLMQLILGACSDAPDMPIQAAPDEVVDLTSQYLSFGEATELASQYLAEFSDAPSRSSGSYGNAKVSFLNGKSFSRSGGVDSTFYVINFENGGAVIMAADRRVASRVYALSPDGNFSTTPDPVQEEYFNWAYNDAINAATDSVRGVVAIGYENDMISRAKVDNVIPIIMYFNGIGCIGHPTGRTLSVQGGEIGRTTWHQSYPYNGYLDGFVAGCEAIAMGQIMTFHRNPKTFNGHSYNWEEMISSPYMSDMNSTGASDVAYLIKELGHLLDTSYGIDKSTSSIYKAHEVFNALGYRTSKVLTYTASQCAKSLINVNLDIDIELSPDPYVRKQNGPVLMRGSIGGSTSGHAWIVEAAKQSTTKYEFYRLDNNEFYLAKFINDIDIYINWGKGGFNNGYYKSPGNYAYNSNEIYDSNFLAIYDIYYDGE